VYDVQHSTQRTQQELSGSSCHFLMLLISALFEGGLLVPCFWLRSVLAHYQSQNGVYLLFPNYRGFIFAENIINQKMFYFRFIIKHKTVLFFSFLTHPTQKGRDGALLWGVF
jgi:hypothetical protein